MQLTWAEAKKIANERINPELLSQGMEAHIERKDNGWVFEVCGLWGGINHDGEIVCHHYKNAGSATMGLNRAAKAAAARVVAPKSTPVVIGIYGTPVDYTPEQAASVDALVRRARQGRRR